MNRILKAGAIICLAFFAFGKMSAQVTKTLKIDSIVVLDPILIGGVTHFQVTLSVTNLLLLPDTLQGDLFYYYRTDSMISAGAPARTFLIDSVFESVTTGFIDTVPVDIQPNEIRTTPVNLIILWPAMVSAEPFDSTSDSIYVFSDGFLFAPGIPETEKQHILFPCPAMQYIYIRPEEINLIHQISILSMEGKMLNQYFHQELSSGFINLDHLASGNYMVELRYFDNKIIRTKILKH